MSKLDLLSVIIAANNEESYIAACLDALLAQVSSGPLEVIVVANGCTDTTAEIVDKYVPRFVQCGQKLRRLELERPGKVAALNAGDSAAHGATRAYLDADVVCDPMVFGQLRAALDTDAARYATGTLAVAPANSWVTRNYAGFWQELPFVKGGAVGAGLFAVNPSGRALWGAFPDIISDDTFVRMQFSPDQRVEVKAMYHWPMIEGWRGLVKVRRRQDAGVREIYERYPDLRGNEGKADLGKADLIKLACRHPIGFATYLSVHLGVRGRAHDAGWARGR